MSNTNDHRTNVLNMLQMLVLLERAHTKYISIFDREHKANRTHQYLTRICAPWIYTNNWKTNMKLYSRTLFSGPDQNTKSQFRPQCALTRLPNVSFAGKKISLKPRKNKNGVQNRRSMMPLCATVYSSCKSARSLAGEILQHKADKHHIIRWHK